MELYLSATNDLYILPYEQLGFFYLIPNLENKYHPYDFLNCSEYTLFSTIQREV